MFLWKNLRPDTLARVLQRLAEKRPVGPAKPQAVAIKDAELAAGAKER